MSTNPESLFLRHKEELNGLIDDSLAVIDDVNQFKSQQPSFALEYPNADGNLAKSLKVLDSKHNMICEKALNESTSYLSKLKSRLQDKQSRIMITGDLNAGKSTLINSLIGRNLLPTDQQPCTQAFCEVLPFLELQSSQEVKILGFHSTDGEGVELRLDELKAELQKEDSTFCWFKLFANIPADFLHSQVSISLIDSPGLNTDQIKTTHLFSQQQDIDVIVFVINAAFHLTLSGRQFLQQAAKERQKIFFIVNKFDEIVNAEKCKNQILKQIGEVLPEMNVNDMSDLIHFVSAKSVQASDCIPLESNPDSPIESNEIKLNLEEDGKDKQGQFQAGFEQMKEALIDFVFLKRAISKLAPVKTYTSRLLQDLLELSAFNIRRLTAENRSITSKLDQIKPLLHQKESAQPRLQCQLNDISENALERTKETTFAAASAFHRGLLRTIQNRPFGHILKGGLFVSGVFVEASKEYAQFCQTVQVLMESTKSTGLEEMKALSQEHAIELESQPEARFVFSLPTQLPLKQLSFFDLVDPRSVLEHFGILNLTSLISGVVAYQPLLNICYRLAGRLGINPVFLGLAAIGGIGFYLSHLASSSVERSIRSRLQSLFAGRFNLEGWAVDLSDRASQAVFVYLSARSSRIVSAYAGEVEKSRRESASLQGSSEQLSDQILFLKDLSRRIETLIGRVQTINL